VVIFFELYSVWWVCFDCTIFCVFIRTALSVGFFWTVHCVVGFYWTVLYIVGLFGLYCVL